MSWSLSLKEKKREGFNSILWAASFVSTLGPRGKLLFIYVGPPYKQLVESVELCGRRGLLGYLINLERARTK